MSVKPTQEQLDAILPQTQCGLCGYGGCMPYAEALIRDNAAINLCPPGGVKGLYAIAELMHVDASPFVAEMEAKAKPKMLAVIREMDCIGCTKCLAACPVDAILGASKEMHTIIANECTGCELCIAPCPVDCIDMIVMSEESEQEEKLKADQARMRFQNRQQRLNEVTTIPKPRNHKPTTQTLDDKKSYIQEVLKRAKNKRKL